MTNENENDVMNDVITRLHGEYGNIMGVLDCTKNTIDVRTINGDIITITITLTTTV